MLSLLKVNYKLHSFIEKPCYYRETKNLDWAPTLHLEKEYVSQSAINRFKRSKNNTPVRSIVFKYKS